MVINQNEKPFFLNSRIFRFLLIIFVDKIKQFFRDLSQNSNYITSKTPMKFHIVILWIRIFAMPEILTHVVKL
jgi:hypothetical protein